ncbi:uncharacterized protein [Rutidosis leptorrhynchoides]|uniref:uncharacterized protein n=1 Tax=Rutidosis leptorrhynchoides TaxID=125765 RepID=UPI003A994016
MLQSINLPTFSEGSDRLVWRSIDGTNHKCLVSHVWEAIRPRAVPVSWFKVVWFPQCIPKHAFILWLVMGERLKTQDKLKPWDLRNHPVLKCMLCDDNMDSHAHIFFECKFSLMVWQRVKGLMRFPLGTNDWKVCRDVLAQHAGRNNSKGVVAKLCFAASVYTLWAERNNQVFNGRPKTVDQVFELIRSNVRLNYLDVMVASRSFFAQLLDALAAAVLY